MTEENMTKETPRTLDKAMELACKQHARIAELEREVVELRARLETLANEAEAHLKRANQEQGKRIAAEATRADGGMRSMEESKAAADAPPWYNHMEAVAWAYGYNTCLAEMEELCRRIAAGENDAAKAKEGK